jgi:hypothetical protein
MIHNNFENAQQAAYGRILCAVIKIKHFKFDRPSSGAGNRGSIKNTKWIRDNN